MKDTTYVQDKTVYVLYKDYPEYIKGGREDIGVTKSSGITSFGQTIDVGMFL